MRRSIALALVAGGAAVAAGTLIRSRLGRIPQAVGGIFPNGMAYARLGTGPKTLLFIRSGPGNVVPTDRLFVALSAFWLGPFLEKGYTIWNVTRKRDMPKGYTISDMADDYAGMIAQEFKGKVDLVIGEEAYGGMIGFCLAARHPDRFGHLAVMLAGYAMTDEGKAFELDFAKLMSEDRKGEAGALVTDLIAPDLRVPGRVARAVGALLVRVMFGEPHPYFARDVLTEAEAVAAFDAREILPQIPVPVLLIGCDRDFEFPKEVYEETARLIPDCTLKVYGGKTAFQAGSDKRLPKDVLDFVGERSQVRPDATGHIREEGRVEAPVEDVWAFLRDTSRWHEWDPRSEYSDFSGPVDEVGTTFVETSRLMAWDMKAHHAVVEVEPERLLHHRSDKGFDIFFRLEPDGDATHLVVDCDYQLPQHLPGVVKDLLSRSLIERTMRENGERFKVLAEATVQARSATVPEPSLAGAGAGAGAGGSPGGVT
jgi:pimeloyl-ACP methyl ester carboxylesterase/uncharacterized membrane protein